MQNVNMEAKGDKLTITVDLKQDLGKSKSGKSVNIATTGGNVDVPGKPGVKIGLNIYRKAD
jgi:hypothetical protein